jgi:hypothetical protein
MSDNQSSATAAYLLSVEHRPGGASSEVTPGHTTTTFACLLGHEKHDSHENVIHSKLCVVLFCFVLCCFFFCVVVMSHRARPPATPSLPALASHARARATVGALWMSCFDSTCSHAHPTVRRLFLGWIATRIAANKHPLVRCRADRSQAGICTVLQQCTLVLTWQPGFCFVFGSKSQH